MTTYSGRFSVFVSIFIFGLVWFVAAVTGNTDNLPSARSLSKSFLQQLKNKFSFFPCQASKPYNHKAFPRFNARQTIGKNFAASVIFRRRSAGKQGEGLPGGTYQEQNPSGKPKRKGQGKGKDGKGRNEGERKERTGREGKESMLQEPIASL